MTVATTYIITTSEGNAPVRLQPSSKNEMECGMYLVVFAPKLNSYVVNKAATYLDNVSHTTVSGYCVENDIWRETKA